MSSEFVAECSAATVRELAKNYAMYTALSAVQADYIIALNATTAEPNLVAEVEQYLQEYCDKTAAVLAEIERRTEPNAELLAACKSVAVEFGLSVDELDDPSWSDSDKAVFGKVIRAIANAESVQQLTEETEGHRESRA